MLPLILTNFNMKWHLESYFYCTTRVPEPCVDDLTRNRKVHKKNCCPKTEWNFEPGTLQAVSPSSWAAWCSDRGGRKKLLRSQIKHDSLTRVYKNSFEWDRGHLMAIPSNPASFPITWSAPQAQRRTLHVYLCKYSHFAVSHFKRCKYFVIVAHRQMKFTLENFYWN